MAGSESAEHQEERTKVRRFWRWISRLRQPQQATAEDTSVIQIEAGARSPTVSSVSSGGERGSGREVSLSEVDRVNQEAAANAFYKYELPLTSSFHRGLAKLCLKEIPADHQAPLTDGGFGTIKLAYRVTDVRRPLEARDLLIAKTIKPPHAAGYQKVWREAAILHLLQHHPHVIQFEGVFGLRSPDADATRPAAVVLLTQYATAGDLRTEVLRHPGRTIPEPGTRYYLRQICAAVEYTHGHRVTHNDLNMNNVVLRYLSDGTKECLLADFGISRIYASARSDDFANGVRRDIHGLVSGIAWMRTRETSTATSSGCCDRKARDTRSRS